MNNIKLSNFQYARIIICTLWVLISGSVGISQDTISSMQSIEEILVTARLKPSKSVFSMESDTLSLAQQMLPTIRNVLQSQAGILAFNQENFAQDIRISIRGFGSRSAFGIRGIRIFQDGIPLTSPDGTSQMDEINVLDIQSMDIFKSGLGTRFGNGSGASISLKTTDFFKGGQVSAGFNSWGAYSLGIKHGIQKSKVSNVFSAGHQYFLGKREHSQSQVTTIYNRTRAFFSDRLQVDFIGGAYFSPKGQDPGALNAEEFLADRFQANIRNKQFDADESVQGLTLAAISKYFVHDQDVLRTSIYYKKRDFNAQLPTANRGWIDLQRNLTGFSVNYEHKRLQNWLLNLGLSGDYQRDNRQNAANNDGIQGNLQSDQIESASNAALFAQSVFQKNRWEVQSLIRFDINQYLLSDLFESDGIQNGKISYANVNGALGTSYSVNAKWVWHANVSSTFEMPTLNELSNNPFDNLGFNATLNPEISYQYETGISFQNGQKLRSNINLFWINTTQQISGYELAQNPGRIFYQNIGNTIRKGIETNFLLEWSKNFFTSANYTYSYFTYENFSIGARDLSGNFQPLIPKHKIYMTVGLAIANIFRFELTGGYNHKLYLDDANLTTIQGYGECHLAIHTHEKISKRITAGIQIQNLFNLLEYSNFRANAAFSRYYEAASPQYLGVMMRYTY